MHCTYNTRTTVERHRFAAVIVTCKNRPHRHRWQFIFRHINRKPNRFPFIAFGCNVFAFNYQYSTPHCMLPSFDANECMPKSIELLAISQSFVSALLPQLYFIIVQKCWANSSSHVAHDCHSIIQKSNWIDKHRIGSVQFAFVKEQRLSNRSPVKWSQTIRIYSQIV